MILVLNSGSSSLKFRLYAVPTLDEIARGMVEAIGTDKSKAVIVPRGGHGTGADAPRPQELQVEVPDHASALAVMGRLLTSAGLSGDGLSTLTAVGHRVVHGGERFSSPVVVDGKILEELEALAPLAPLHNPANILGIRSAMEQAPDVPQVAVFDTAFHQEMPEHAYLYAIPRKFHQEYGIRRYGFHGVSHGFVAQEAARFLGRQLNELRLVTLHLGNGASAAAVSSGRSIDTSMGLTPLEGLVMGTRCGDLDPAVVAFMARRCGMGIDEIDTCLNEESGLKGLCGHSDMRAITELARQGNQDCLLALEAFCYRIRKYIGAYAAALQGLDAVVFTGGIGENSPLVRQRSIEGLGFLGLHLDRHRNEECKSLPADISDQKSLAKILVIATNEELQIARHTLEALDLGLGREALQETSP